MPAEPPVDARASLLQRAEADLGRTDSAAAVEEFERVAAMGHGADGELGLVRAYMQAGEYRRALAFCAHVAGEHFELPGAAVLYAWLLRVGGQPEVAQVVLAELRARAPSDPLAVAAAQAFASPWPTSPGALLIERPHRVAPVELAVPGQSPPPPEARVISSGVLLDGRHALIPTFAGAPQPTRLWVRTGLGQTSAAIVDPLVSSPPGVVVLRLSAPIAATAASGVVTRSPFAGSPGFAVEYAEGALATPAWPLLRQGFFGASSGDAGPRPLGIEVGAGRQGGPVFDASGRLAGIALHDKAGRAVMLPVASWPNSAGPLAPDGGPASAATTAASAPLKMPADELYERALRLALQVIAAP